MEAARRNEPGLGGMHTRAASWLAWSLASLCVVMFLVGAVLCLLARSVDIPDSWEANLSLANMLGGGLFLVFPIVGALISSSNLRNPIGWLLLADGLLWVLTGLLDYYAIYGVAQPGSVSFPVEMAGINNWLWVPAVGLLGTYPFLLFPGGRLPSNRWRPLAWLSGSVIALVSAGIALSPGPLQGLGGVQNLFALLQPWMMLAFWAVLPLLPLCMFASAVSLVLRYWRSRGVERQQIKWIAFAASVVGSLYLIAMTTAFIFPSGAWFSVGSPLWMDLIAYTALLSFILIPIAVGFAVLKYRLYNIDLLINRTLVYGALTAMLALIYLGGMATVQTIFRTLTGQEQQAQLAIVASTLAIAALFNPLRSRIQSFIDRRFYPRKYDARKTLEAFSARLRDETDLDSLTGNLVGVVHETIRPEHAFLWLRDLDGTVTRDPDSPHSPPPRRTGGGPMSVRAVRIIPWVVVPLAVMLMIGRIFLSTLNRAADLPLAAGIVVFTLLELVGLGFLALGLLVAYRRPRNPVGWIIAGAGAMALASDFVESYAVYALITDPGSIPGGEVMAWVSNWIFIPVIFAAPAMLFLLFPDGNLISRRWMPVFWIVILTTCAAMVSSFLQPVMNEAPFDGVVNPLVADPPRAILAPLSYIGWPGMAASFLVAAFAMILRLRRSRGVERQQLKWLAAAATVLPLASATGVASYYLGYEWVAGFLSIFPIIPIFLAAGYAVLRYRLYDIDIIINRTLVYGSLTVSLALVYVGSVVTLQYVFRTLAGGGSQLVIVASTLAIAALFNPLRRRIQDFVDRRFYRSKYDAARTLEVFSARLRDEIDLEQLNVELLYVVRATMQPDHVSLWLRKPERET